MGFGMIHFFVGYELVPATNVRSHLRALKRRIYFNQNTKHTYALDCIKEGSTVNTNINGNAARKEEDALYHHKKNGLIIRDS